jgi:hypothetical protein
MHIWGTLSSRTQINLSLLITTLLSSPTFLLQKSPSAIGIHIRQCSKGQCLMHTLVYIRHLPQGQCSRMAHIDICLKGKCSRIWHTLVYIVHCPKGQGSGMAHIGVHCTLHKMAMLKNVTYLCKLQLHVDMGSIIHFCTDTNTQNRTNFTKSLNTRFITENTKTSTFVLFKILWTLHHHVSWQASEVLFLHSSITKFDQQATSMLRMILCTKHQCFKFTIWEPFVWKIGSIHRKERAWASALAP